MILTRESEILKKIVDILQINWKTIHAGFNFILTFVVEKEHKKSLYL